MADTKRTITDLLTNLFQDGQASDSITAQDIRDLIVSLAATGGSYYMEDNTTVTVLTAQDTWYKISGATTVVEESSDIDASTTDNKVVYEGAPARILRLHASIAFIANTNNQIIEFAFFKNGTTQVHPHIARKVGTGSDVGALSMSGSVSVVTNDYVELWARNTSSSGTTITAQDLEASVVGILTA